MATLTPLSIKTRSIPTQKRLVEWNDHHASQFALNLVQSAKSTKQGLVIIVETMQQAERLVDDCQFFGGEALIFPDTETLPYDPFSPQVDIISQRLSVLFQLKMGQVPLLIVTIPTLMQRIAPQSFLDANVLLFKEGDQIDRDNFRLSLERAGYNNVTNVVAPGEFAIRGALFDLYPMGSQRPLRIDFFDDEIDSIRTFDPDSQGTIENIAEISILPAREFEINAIGLERFKRKFEEAFNGDPMRASIYNSVIKGRLPSGIENYLPLFFEETATLFDYLPKATTLISFPNIHHEAEQFQRLINERYERYRHDIERPLLIPSRLYLTLNALQGLIKEYPTITLQFEAPIQEKISLEDIKAHTHSGKFPLILAAETAGRRESLLNRLNAEEIQPTIIYDFNEALNTPTPLMLITGALHRGFINESPKFTLITENEFLGIAPRRRYRAKEEIADIESILTNLDTLQIGDPVIHLTHGIGRYDGLSIIDNTELVVIQYKDNAKLYLPVTDLDQLSLYSGASKENAPWHKLGSGQWDRARKKAAEKANDTAVELLDIYSRREAQKAKGMMIDEKSYHDFDHSFPFETTPDQQRAIDEVLADLKEGKMDRIICGDVGFGKTEVAMRAAFVAVMNGYQAAILSPTTLLAEQHAQSFQDRFSDWPISIKSLSRFRKGRETRDILAEMANGELDIVIGTHRLLSEDTQFKNLGLVVIDEEHRFGVRQKERLRELRTEVNFLAMTATPIPRTLNMGLSGLKSLSIIATPPEDRIAVKTFVNEWSDELILEACMREFKRGGQVFFLHNEVRTIENVEASLTELFPDIRIATAHGQMHENDLEQVMLDFHHHRIDLLICTTIIESGIDIPNANTMIINRADRLGLAQIHQIRGRVGRSHHRAYCYLIVPSEKEMTRDAVKRIDAVMENDQLGAGFMLANHDLEIRGAGELLGEEQSGEINSIGFTLYLDMLSRAVELVKSGGSLSTDEPFNHGTEINVGVPAIIQEDYIPDVSQRLSYYKRIASCSNIDQLDDLQIELIDRFGLLPDPTKMLFKLSELKIKARPLNFNKIEANKDGIRITFGEYPKFNPDKLIRLVQDQPHFYQLQGQTGLRYNFPLENPELRINAIIKLIEVLS